MPSGGDIIEITCSNSEVGSRTLYPKSSEDSTYDLGGLRTNDDDNMIDGGGNAIYQMNRKRWSFGVKCAFDMTNGDLEYLTDLSASMVETTMTFANINGTIYKGTGKIVGEIQGNGNSSTVDIKAAGSGLLEII